MISRSTLLIVGLLAVPAVGGLAAVLDPAAIERMVRGVTEVLPVGGPAGHALALAVEVLVAASGIVPASTIGLLAGSLYGIGPGFATASLALLSGAAITFALSRALGRRRPAAGNPGRFAHLDRLIERDGWRIVCLLRISPVMPFAATSYGLGLTSVSMGDYLLGTLASLPALGGYVAAGRLAGASADAWRHGLGIAHVALLAAGVVATVLLTVKIGRALRQASPALDAPEATPAPV